MPDHSASPERPEGANPRKSKQKPSTRHPVLRSLSKTSPRTGHGLSSNGRVGHDFSRPAATEYSMSQHANDSSESSHVLPVLARNLTRLRLQKGFSLEKLAELSGVDDASLEALSAGKHEPNIKTLWSLANALDVPFRALIAEAPAETNESGAAAQVHSRRVLASRDGARNSEVYEIKLAANAEETVAPRRSGAVENVLVTQGSAEVRAGALHYQLHEGESVSLRADQARHYQSSGGAAATLYVVISQPAD